MHIHSRLRAGERADPAARHATGDVVVGDGLVASLGSLVRGAVGPGARRAFVVLDAGAARAGHDPCPSLRAAGFEVVHASFEPGEEHKSPDAAFKLAALLAEHRFDRWDPVVAVGGGITGDVAGFAAGIYRRGVPLVQCPTTLLAMVDASIGGKTGVNLRVPAPGGGTLLTKNMLGVFHDPALVVIDLRTLATLPARELRAGLAECVKHAMLGASAPRPDAGLTDWIRTHAPTLGGINAASRTDLFAELVTRNVTLKAGVVLHDPRELAPDDAGGRALLNLGHTFGHAIETLDGLADPDGRPVKLLHGEAVGLGLIAASAAGAALGLCGAEVERWSRDVLGLVGLPTRIGGMPDNGTVRARMAHDKKARAGSLRLVVPNGIGRARVVVDPPAGAVDTGLDAIRSS
ncbi:MAG: 3-dehydroquinate synthase family protein [Planctomycetota bacterium]|nr:3-dehydroquinate synthase family protein [Planctomycetota bacterium]